MQNLLITLDWINEPNRNFRFRYESEYKTHTSYLRSSNGENIKLKFSIPGVNNCRYKDQWCRIRILRKDDQTTVDTDFYFDHSSRQKTTETYKLINHCLFIKFEFGKVFSLPFLSIRAGNNKQQARIGLTAFFCDENSNQLESQEFVSQIIGLNGNECGMKICKISESDDVVDGNKRIMLKMKYENPNRGETYQARFSDSTWVQDVNVTKSGNTFIVIVPPYWNLDIREEVIVNLQVYKQSLADCLTDPVPFTYMPRTSAAMVTHEVTTYNVQQTVEATQPSTSNVPWMSGLDADPVPFTYMPRTAIVTHQVTTQNVQQTVEATQSSTSNASCMSGLDADPVPFTYMPRTSAAMVTHEVTTYNVQQTVEPTQPSTSNVPWMSGLDADHLPFTYMPRTSAAIVNYEATTQNVQQTVEPTQPSTSNAAWISDLDDISHEINPLPFSLQLDKKRKLDDDDPLLGGVHNKQPRFQSSPQTSDLLRVPLENQQQINEYENFLDFPEYDDLAQVWESYGLQE